MDRTEYFRKYNKNRPYRDRREEKKAYRARKKAEASRAAELARQVEERMKRDPFGGIFARR